MIFILISLLLKIWYSRLREKSFTYSPRNEEELLYENWMVCAFLHTEIGADLKSWFESQTDGRKVTVHTVFYC